MECPLCNRHPSECACFRDNFRTPEPRTAPTASSTGQPSPFSSRGATLRESTALNEVVVEQIELLRKEMDKKYTEQQTAIINLRNRIEQTLLQKSAASSYTLAQQYQKMAKETVPKKNKLWFEKAAEPPRRNDDGRSVFPRRHECPQPGSSETKAVQPFWTELIGNLPKDGRVYLVDTHSKVSFGKRKPDVVGYLVGKPTSIFNIVLLGDIKPSHPTKQDFDDEEKGHLVSFMGELLDYQPHRPQITGFLSDGVIIQFFALINKNGGRVLKEATPLYLSDEGGLYLAGFLKNPPFLQHDYLELQIGEDPVLVDDFLGMGGSAVVFEGQYKDTRGVVKIFHHQEALQREASNLRTISALAHEGLVPTLCSSGSEPPILILEPIGQPFAATLYDFLEQRDKTLASGNDFCQLIDILEKAHTSCKIVHRDVRLVNFFRHVDSPRVFLNDWGCAVPHGQLVRFSGALQHAPKRILQAYRDHADYLPEYSDDLEMVVRSVFHCLNLPRFLEISAAQDADRLIEFWDVHLRPSSWAEMVRAARELNYAALKACVAQLLPCDPRSTSTSTSAATASGTAQKRKRADQTEPLPSQYKRARMDDIVKTPPLDNEMGVIETPDPRMVIVERTPAPHPRVDIVEMPVLRDLTVDQLKLRLRARGLSTTGRKQDLVDRLRKAFLGEDHRRSGRK